jgi:hypothetical protein
VFENLISERDWTKVQSLFFARTGCLNGTWELFSAPGTSTAILCFNQGFNQDF